MLAYIEKILEYCKDIKYSDFENNTLICDACVFNLSQIGELTTKLDREFTEEHSDIPWGEMKGLRNKIVHDYEGVNLILVWEIISSDLPKLKEQLLKL